MTQVSNEKGRSTITSFLHLGEIPSLMVVREDLVADQLPVVICYHGWTNVKESTLPQASAFAQAGYRVFCPDAYLHGERRPQGHQYQSYPQLLATIQQAFAEFPDLKAAIGQEAHVAEAFRPLIVGTSMGGMIVSTIASTYAKELAGLVQYISTAAPYDFLTAAEANLQSLAGKQGVGDEELAFFKAHSLIDHLDQVANLPYFVYHGTADEFVPVIYDQDLAQKMAATYPDAPFHYLEVVDETHWIPYPVIEGSVAFMTSHLS